MLEFQDVLFKWMAAQSGGAGAVVFFTGLIYAFFGFRFYRVLLALSCAGLGALVGALGAELSGLPLHYLAGGGALAAGAAGGKFRRFGTLLASASAFGLLALYLGSQFGAKGMPLLIVAAAIGIVAGILALLSPRTSEVVLTTVQGAGLLVVGFVGVSTHAVPTIGETFCDWASDQAWLVPALMVMLFATGYSLQASRQQGDVVTGR